MYLNVHKAFCKQLLIRLPFAKLFVLIKMFISVNNFSAINLPSNFNMTQACRRREIQHD